jgi:hypothetical protein
MADALVSRCLATGVERPHDDVLADRVAFDSRTELRHRARHLVADDLRHAHPVIHVTLGDVKIRPADAAERYVEPHLSRPRLDQLALAEREPTPTLVVHRRHFGSIPSASSMCLSHSSPSER